MNCLNCGKNIEGSTQKKFCSDKCRKAFSRKVGQENSDKLENSDKKSDKIDREIGQNEKSDKLGQFKTTSGYPYKKTDKIVYGRKAVIYPHEANGVVNSSGAKWTTRPEPENPDDIPNPDNRTYYKRKDGSMYMIDAGGDIHNQ